MLRPGDRFGQYRIDSVLGEGGMGVVYAATDMDAKRPVALKVVNPDLALDPDGNQGIEAARRLVREGRAAGSLRHPNAIAVLDTGEIDGTPYIAMELAKGRSLGQFIGDKRIPMDQRIEWLTGMARGLAAAHDQGIVHRDVKPENVMVCDDGWVKLFDFGVAKPIADPRASIDLTVVTHTGIVVGTPLYMAPEQVLGDKLDVRSDQYAWATVAYELLSGGTHPITTTAESHLPVPFAILKGTAKHLREVAPTVPPRVAEVVMRALSKDPRSRFKTLNEVVAALDAYLSHPGSDADTTAERPARVAFDSGVSHSEPTVAVHSPVAVIDDEPRGGRAREDDYRETLVYRPEHDSATIARVPFPGNVEMDNEATLARAPMARPQPAPIDNRPAAPVRVAAPAPAVAPRRSNPPFEERADLSVHGPSFSGSAPIATPAPATRPEESSFVSSFAPPPPSTAGPPSVRLAALQAKARTTMVQRDWVRRLALWIPVLIVAAVAGYGAYALLAR